MFKKTVAAYVVAVMFGLGNAMPIIPTKTHEFNLTAFCVVAGTICDKFNLTAVPTLSPEAVKPNNTEHGLVGQQYTHKGNQLGTWLRPVCNFEFDGFFRTYRIDNLESNNNVDKLKKKLGKFVTDYTYQPETPDWYESSGISASRWMLTFKVDDFKNTGMIQQDVEQLLGNGNQVPCGTF